MLLLNRAQHGKRQKKDIILFMTTDQRAARVKFLFLDVDGVLTDGRLYYAPDGGIVRAFHTQDGHGIRSLMRCGVNVAVVSAADDHGALERLRQLGIVRAHFAVPDKKVAVQRVLDEEKLLPENAAFMGDDIPDIAAMQYVGFAVAPPNAVSEVAAIAHWMPQRAGGSGAVRELCDRIIANLPQTGSSHSSAA